MSDFFEVSPAVLGTWLCSLVSNLHVTLLCTATEGKGSKVEGREDSTDPQHPPYSLPGSVVLRYSERESLTSLSPQGI